MSGITGFVCEDCRRSTSGHCGLHSSFHSGVFEDIPVVAPALGGVRYGPPDPLDVRLTRRDVLALLAEAARQADQPHAREFYDALWQRFTVQWRQPE